MKFDDKQINVDILRLIMNKARKYSLNILINGHSQSGKSTFLFHIANRIKQIQLGIKKPTWKEWDWKEFTSTTPRNFVRLWDENSNEVIALEEAGEQLNYLEWFSTMAKVFSSTTRTQGLKHNICFMITPMSTDLQKHNKENIDFRIWVAKRYDETRIAIIKNRWVEIDYLKDKWRLRWLPDWIVRYPIIELEAAKEYTDFLAGGMKVNIMNKNKELTGIYNPNKLMTEKNCPDWVRDLL
jgi:hypothetical protein